MQNRGFTIFFAVLVSSLALAVGLAIYDLLSRELVLSQTATQSQYAIYAADTGAECALYWDNQYAGPDGETSAFGTSTDDTWPSSGSNLFCNNQDISTLWSSPDPISKNDHSATTTFTITMGSATGPCVKVEVAKSGDPSKTTVTSHGYNTCSTGGIVRLERALQVSY